MTKESIFFSLYHNFHSLFLLQRSNQCKKISWQRNREHWKEKKGKVKRKGGTRVWCFRAGYFSNIDYTIFDHLK